MLKRPDVGEHLVSSIENKLQSVALTAQVDNLKNYLGVVEEVIDGFCGRNVVEVSVDKFSDTDKYGNKCNGSLSLMLADKKKKEGKSLYHKFLLDMVITDKGLNDSSAATSKVYADCEISHESVKSLDLQNGVIGGGDFNVITGSTVIALTIGSTQYALKCIKPSVSSLFTQRRKITTKAENEIRKYAVVKKNKSVEDLFVPKYAHGRLWIFQTDGMNLSYEVILLKKMCDIDLMKATRSVLSNFDQKYTSFALAFKTLKKLHDSGFVHGNPKQHKFVWDGSVGSGDLKLMDPETLTPLNGLPLYVQNIRKLIDINILLFYSLQMIDIVTESAVAKFDFMDVFSRRLRNVSDQVLLNPEGKYFFYEIMMFYPKWNEPVVSDSFFEEVRKIYPENISMIEKIDFGRVFEYFSNIYALSSAVKYISLVYMNSRADSFKGKRTKTESGVTSIEIMSLPGGLPSIDIGSTKPVFSQPENVPLKPVPVFNVDDLDNPSEPGQMDFDDIPPPPPPRPLKPSEIVVPNATRFQNNVKVTRRSDGTYWIEGDDKVKKKAIRQSGDTYMIEDSKGSKRKATDLENRELRVAQYNDFNKEAREKAEEKKRAEPQSVEIVWDTQGRAIYKFPDGRLVMASREDQERLRRTRNQQQPRVPGNGPQQYYPPVPVVYSPPGQVVYRPPVPMVYSPPGPRVYNPQAPVVYSPPRQGGYIYV